MFVWICAAVKREACSWCEDYSPEHHTRSQDRAGETSGRLGLAVPQHWWVLCRKNYLISVRLNTVSGTVTDDSLHLFSEYDVSGFLGRSEKLSSLEEVIAAGRGVCCGYSNLCSEMCRWMQQLTKSMKVYYRHNVIVKTPLRTTQDKNPRHDSDQSRPFLYPAWS